MSPGTLMVMAVAGVVVTLAVGVIVLAMLRVVVPPDKVAVVSGRAHRGADGSTIGFRVVIAGATVRVPLIEQVTLMSTAPIEVTIDEANVYFADGPGRVALQGTVRVTRRSPDIERAVERFLAVSPAEIGRVARDTIAGIVRGLAPKLRSEELARAPERFVQAVIEQAEPDLAKLGLELASLAPAEGRVAAQDGFAERLAELGLPDAVVTTELACEVPRDRATATARIEAGGAVVPTAGTFPALDRDHLRAAGAGELACREGRAVFRWTSAPVTTAQLAGAARVLATLAADGQAYR